MVLSVILPIKISPTDNSLLDLVAIFKIIFIPGKDEEAEFRALTLPGFRSQIAFRNAIGCETVFRN